MSLKLLGKVDVICTTARPLLLLASRHLISPCNIICVTCYPLSRFFFVYVLHGPSVSFGVLRSNFLDTTLSVNFGGNQRDEVLPVTVVHYPQEKIGNPCSVICLVP